jgi:hypothetical protein
MMTSLGVARVVVSGAPPAPDGLAMPQKGTPSDPSGRALALHMAQRALQAMGGTLAVDEHTYVVTLPLGASEATPPK